MKTKTANRPSVQADVRPRCGADGCPNIPTTIVLVYQAGGFDEAFACDVHAAMRNCCKLGELVGPNKVI